MQLPKDPFILLSTVNMKLRDEHEDLEEFCASMGVDPEELSSLLESVGYTYDPASNQFKPK